MAGTQDGAGNRPIMVGHYPNGGCRTIRAALFRSPGGLQLAVAAGQ
jgi:hypothetical protein